MDFKYNILDFTADDIKNLLNLSPGYDPDYISANSITNVTYTFTVDGKAMFDVDYTSGLSSNTTSLYVHVYNGQLKADFVTP